MDLERQVSYFTGRWLERLERLGRLALRRKYPRTLANPQILPVQVLVI
jgi:hypothetical protein